VTNTPYHVRIAPAAQRHLRVLQAKEQKLIVKLVEALAINPRPPGAVKVEGMTGLYCENVNHHRLIYKVEEQEVLLLLVL
jgi:mRNA interferase RelE/StbE